MFSANTEKGPVTPRIVKGCTENLGTHQFTIIIYLGKRKSSRPAHKLKMTPHNPVLKTTSIVPQVSPVKTYRSLANVIPGNRFVKKT